MLALAAGPACSSPQTSTSASAGDSLVPGATYAVDLDGDPEPEVVRIDRTPASVTIIDGDSVYTSRARWQVVGACLGDLDHDGLLEVVTLLDSDEGRHVGLFAYFGGEYRERLVTSVLTPRPVSLAVVHGADPAGDLLVLTTEPDPGEAGPQEATYRWNGFGFTAVSPEASP